MPATTVPGVDPTPQMRARRLIRTADRAVLATAMRGDAALAEGHPYGSLVLVACDHDASPLLLISDLADHTKNLRANGSVSLLYDGTAGLAEPLTGARVTVAGLATPVDDLRLLARYTARHPSAADWAGFTDFSLWRIAVEKTHLVAGFGEIHWMAGPDVLFDPSKAGDLATAEPDIITHMNADHADALDAIAGHLLNADGVGWSMTGIDPEGIDLCHTGRFARLEFAEYGIVGPVWDAAGARNALVELAGKARAAGP